MADKPATTPITQPVVNIPGLQPVPVVAIRLPDGTIALRHPSELQKPAGQPAVKGGK
ncbi:MAG: hypothetical protein ACRD4R_13040 [Candidatus Acidiferrales bacterium]